MYYRAEEMEAQSNYITFPKLQLENGRAGI